jgi:Glycine zipper
MKAGNIFKTVNRIIIPVIILGLGHTVYAQQPVPTTKVLPDTAKMTYNQISQQMKLYVYPSKNQSKQQQKEDEFECYLWAVDQSGIDPLNLPKAEPVPVQTGPTGGAIKGAAKGAAAGAAIGAIAGDAGKGAAIGATAGALAGRRQGKQAQEQQNQQAQASAAASEQAMKDSFAKAFSVCIEGKGYTIK